MLVNTATSTRNNTSYISSLGNILWPVTDLCINAYGRCAPDRHLSGVQTGLLDHVQVQAYEP